MTDTRTVREIRHFHLFCGIGGGAIGFNRGHARVGSLEAKFRCIGGVDNDPGVIEDFGRRVGTAGTLLDMFDRQQYIAFNGCEPPSDWREATPADIQRAAGHERPHIVFLSAPCKGFSGLMSETKSKSEKYQALNRLTIRGVYLMLEAWADDPPELVVFENVPRLANRGRVLLDQIVAMLHHYGYAVAETTHDCGELGALAQSRKRFLLVARHMEKVPPFLYEPEKRPLRGVGEVLGRMPLPGDPRGGPMHRLPKLHWKTWVRLAFVEAGSDWRSLEKFAVQDGKLRDFLIVPNYHDGFCGVRRWDEPSGTITSHAGPSNGSFAVADPRFDSSSGDYGQYGVCGWNEPMGSIINVKSPGQGKFAVQDPRFPAKSDHHKNVFRVVGWNEPSGTVTSGHGPSSGGGCVADPRTDAGRVDRYRVARIGQTSGDTNGIAREIDSATPDDQMPHANDKVQAIIQSLDGTWHRPFTTLELAALQSLVDPEEYLELHGESDSAWRERIGNAVPPDAAAAIANVMGTTLLLAWAGETFVLSAMPVWVQPLTIALSVDMPIHIHPSAHNSP